MLKSVDVTSKMSKDDYKQKIKPLKESLAVLQHQIKVANIPVILLFEGWGAAGKGSVLSDVILTLDPRNFKAFSTLAPACEELRHPFLWRHWAKIPENGLFSIFDRSWYPEVSIDAFENCSPPDVIEDKINSISIFERQLAGNGTIIIKFFLHISQKEQKARLDALNNKKSTSWRVNKKDYQRNKNYKQIFQATDVVLEKTNTDYAPWHIIPANDKRKTLHDVYATIVDTLQTALCRVAEINSQKSVEKRALSSGDFTLLQMPALEEVFLGQEISDDEYDKTLKKLQKKLSTLHNYIYLHKIPIVLAYEGWDAAGKGGNISRLTAALDPRGYTVVPIAAPTPPEKNRQFLWRFWQNIPKSGHITLFDRSWYGRVLVERVEKFAAENEWQRAYQEINEFENELYKWGAVVVKFWLHIDKDEQLRRFESRQNTPEKQWKITDEDWRNREKWEDYSIAVNDMLRLTSTSCAPWVIVESQNKKYARIKVLETVIAAIEEKIN